MSLVLVAVEKMIREELRELVEPAAAALPPPPPPVELLVAAAVELAGRFGVAQLVLIMTMPFVAIAYFPVR